MLKLKKILTPYFLIFSILLCFSAKSENLEKITILGNERVSDETIKMFADIDINDNVNLQTLNNVLKNLYDSNFFKDVSVKFENNNLQINVVEQPIIQNIKYDGIKSKTLTEEITEGLYLKPRSSYNELLLEKDQNLIISKLKEKGYYFSDIQVYLIELDKNTIDVRYDINLGKKAKIKKINFVGNKVFKDLKLKNIIISEEYRFWKFISGKKYLNENIIQLDERLLKNYYLNQGYFEVDINSSFAKLVSEEEFELTFNINAGRKFYFNDLKLTIPNDFDENNFISLNATLNDLNGEIYSINAIQKIVEEIEKITLYEEYKSINANVEETLIDNKLDLEFIIQESPKIFVERINIFGNNVTRENVIRNQLVVDEGDPFNNLLTQKSLNNLKNLNFFKDVTYKVNPGSDVSNKIIDFTVEEKPTGEILTGAGFGTDGASILFAVKENNYLGKGLGVEMEANLSGDSVKGKFSVSNPNFNNTDRTAFASIDASETDRLSTSGYKTNKTGFTLGTKFEFLENFKIGGSGRSYYEKIETDSSASATQKKQEGDYWDTFLNLDFDYDKRNQKFQPTDGFRSKYNVDIPLLSETNTFTNTYNFNKYAELFENNRSKFSLTLKSALSLTGEDVKLSERLFIPSSKLRGFEYGKVGPKDGSDFIGGNYITSLNFQSNIPFILENAQNFDASFFIDSANVWGVDYDSSVDDSNKIRSSLGISVDWYTIVGPMNFSLSEAISKGDNDVTQSFRFDIGTTF